MVKKVKAVKVEGCQLTEGRVYSVENESDEYYLVENDEGDKNDYFKWRFEEVQPVAEAPRKFAVGDKVKIVKKVERQGDANKRRFGWALEMDETVGGAAVIVADTFDSFGTYQLDNGWFYLAESLELVEDAPEESTTWTLANGSSITFEAEQPVGIDAHYNFNYSLTQHDMDMGYVKIDPYFVAKQWDLGSKDPSGVIWHIFKTCARFSEKNSKEREITAIYKSIKRLAEIEGVSLD